ncbi:hypothetical protein NUU61_003184 [Penicillium alfredii]|uniref:pH-response transcription factor pacC/RIM101 n=1 Tax=Penicillium alfredii TaxID=1506179 RepID=A0A9W9FT37_9EURO|nr:uncharacterized protein NUU61_003184 [Penicillium alfredii]KAJ5105837.1 hypothetical protein NUU61_003184 [Penicillium alfredii]
MTENNIPPSTATAHATSLPAPVAGAEQAQIVPQASTPASVTATAAAASAAVNSPPMNGTGEQLPCQWVGCTERSPSAEALYEHVCERHVGRKSTNNLNLTCHWGTCNTTTVKRDHITSHIRVHVPLKPHKCDFCGKAFKRPQDLKKHVKTHADDSEIRSPEPGPGLKHHPDMMFPPNPKGYAAATHYFEGPINAVSSPAYTHGAPQYYQPHPAPQPANSHSYGNVYYALSQGQDGNHSYDRKRGYDALNEFFGDLKRRQFDPNSYVAVGQRLQGLQSLQLPILNGPVSDYQPMVASVPVGGGGYSPGGSHAPAYHLPPMSNVRTKSDLINIDQFLEQMQNTIYESEDNVAAAGVAQPGAHYVQGGMSYRTTNSPPSQLPPSHVSAATSAPMMSATSAHSPSTGTPALTPPSSAQSYTSNRSPISLPHTHRVSPPHESGAGMYPRLPSTTVSDSMTAGGAFEHDDRRRYTGGTLQRARPAERELNEDSMDTSHDGKEDRDRTPTGKERVPISESLIDPALSLGTSPDPEQEAAQRTAQAATEVAERDVPVGWLEKARLIDHLRRLVSNLMQNDREVESPSYREQSTPAPGDAMVGIETASTRASPERPQEESTKPAGEMVLYPTLRGVDEDGDSKMPGDDA